MSALFVGYARCSTDQPDLTAQREGLAKLGVAAERIYVDHGLTGTNRARPGLREALAACRAGDTLVVTKLDRLARAKGRLCGKQPKLTRRQEAHLLFLVHSGEYSTAEVADLFGVGRSTVYRAIERQRTKVVRRAGQTFSAVRLSEGT